MLKMSSCMEMGRSTVIIIYVIVGLLFGTSVIMDFLHSKKNEKKNTREEKLSSTFIFLGFCFLFLYQYLNHSKSGLVIVFPLIIIHPFNFHFGHFKKIPQ